MNNKNLQEIIDCLKMKISAIDNIETLVPDDFLEMNKKLRFSEKEVKSCPTYLFIRIFLYEFYVIKNRNLNGKELRKIPKKLVSICKKCLKK